MGVDFSKFRRFSKCHFESVGYSLKLNLRTTQLYASLLTRKRISQIGGKYVSI